jgi:TRAP-type mannitol/chloroaromatic compound transport system substrate-binding protein
VKWSSERVLTMPDGSFRITDVDGNRFTVPPLGALDADSRKRVEVLV